MEDDKNKEYHFLKEETKKVPTNKKRFLKKLGCVIIFAAVFGVVASLLFCLVKQSAEKRQENQNLAVDESTSPEETVVPEQIFVQETIEPTLEGYEALQTQLYTIGSRASRSVVEINSVTSKKDWFEDDFERNGQSSGVILQTTGSEILILTETAMISDANEIQVTFYGDAKASAYMKAYDGSTGIAILAVDKKDVSETTMSVIQSVEISESGRTTPGSFVIGVGSPQGEAFSVVVGNITAANQKISFSDKNYRLFSTSIEAYSDTRGVLLNSEGQVVGLVCQMEDSDALRAINISDISDLITKLMAGKRPAYLGVEISEVTRSVSETYGLPDGVFIKEVDVNSPAVLAGLQVGDVIVKIDGKDVLTESQFEDYMMSAEPEQKMSITVKRQGSNDQYQDVNCRVELGVAE